MTVRWPADEDHIRSAAERLRQGGVIAFPTDTLYGVGARAADAAAVARLYAVKRRPPTQPLIWLVSGAAQVEPFAVITAEAETLMQRYWPGPLTLVLPARGPVPTLAVRAPNHRVALTLISELGEPVASSSANRAGASPPTDADAVIAGLSIDVDVVLDGGACEIGQASTILDLSIDPPRILRQGAIPAHQLLSS